MGNGLVKPVEHPRWEGSSVGIEFGAAPEERSESRLGVETHEGCLEEHRYLNMDQVTALALAEAERLVARYGARSTSCHP